MSRLKTAAAIGAAAVALLAAACSSSSPPAADASARATIPLLTVGLPETVSNLDVSNPNGAFNNEITALSLEQAMVLSPDGKLRPWLATGVTHPNPVTYVYALRHGVTFWNGSPLTAADVAFSWNYDRRPQSGVASFYASVKGIKAQGQYTVVVTLTHPDASWQYTPANSAAEIFSAKFYLAHKQTYGQPGTLVMGTGPWKIDSFDPTTGARLSANPHWWGGKVPIKQIAFKFFSNETSEALALRAGEIDLDPQVENAHSFETTSGAKLTSVPSCQTGWFGMNTRVAPWNDIHVRRAVAYALNRANIIASTGFPATASTTLIAPSELRTLGAQAQVAAIIKSIPFYPYSVARARQQMAESAYPKGFAATLVTFNYGSFINVNEVIAAELHQIGIKAQIKNIGQNAWFAVAVGPDAKRPTMYSTTGDCSPDPSTYDVFLGSQNLAQGQFNVANYAPPAVDQLISSGLTTSNPAARLTIYTKLLRQLATDVPYVPLYVQDVTYASGHYTWPGFDWSWQDSDWALQIRSR